MNNEERSFIKIKSNIMIKDKYEKNKYHYLPLELMPQHYYDKRMNPMLTQQQKIDSEKRLFLASKIIDE
jgi:hypothetical protein